MVLFNEKIKMIDYKKHCFVCGHDKFDKYVNDYLRCQRCNHEILDSDLNQKFIINEDLKPDEIKKITSLESFKSKVLSIFTNSKVISYLLDIGSGSGKFLYLNKKKYLKGAGLEITDDSVNFSRNVLKLDVFKDVKDLKDDINVATAWHSLEHFPPNILEKTLEEISKKMSPNGMLIVSVPNNKSLQYSIFRKSYAFYDVPSHIHQFSPKSLELLLKKYGFKKGKLITSWPYNRFCMIQSCLNIFNTTHNYVYYRLKRKNIKSSFYKDFFNFLLILFFALPALFFSLIDILLPERQSVITMSFEK